MLELEDAPAFYDPDPLKGGQLVRVRLNGECLGRIFPYFGRTAHYGYEAGRVGVIFGTKHPHAEYDGHSYIVLFIPDDPLQTYTQRFYRGELERVT